jgi:ubiquinone/menaquinone biosynthesis C-methylase UbiE
MKEINLKIEEIKRYRREFYDNRALFYDDLWWDGKESHPEMNSFKKLVKIDEGNIVLDVATGTGNYLIEMAKKGALCYGIDISQKMLERLKFKIKQESLEEYVKDIREGEADSLPYQNNFFDLVTCIGLFEYYPIEYTLTVLREISRVLKHGGRCFIDISNPVTDDDIPPSYIYKYDLELFENKIREIGYIIQSKNIVEPMLQILLVI